MHAMAVAFVGLMKNKEEVSEDEIFECLHDPEILIDKIQKVEPALIDESVVKTHMDTDKHITKSFVDSTQEDYKTCSPFAAFLAWSSQFMVLVQYAKASAKLQ
jgi:hypothetical protein